MSYQPAACLVYGLLSTAILAQSPLETEVNQLKEKRDKDLASAVQEINVSYQSALEQLLTRATESKDVQAITQALNSLKVKAKPLTPPTAEAPPKAAHPELLGEWIITVGNYMGTRKLNADGTLVYESGPPGTWKVVGNTLLLIGSQGPTDRFTLTGFSGPFTGKNPNGRELKMKKAGK